VAAVILSFRHHFVFVRPRKVAGTSVEIALSTLCGPDDITSPMVAVDERLRLDRDGHCANFNGDAVLEEAYRAMVRAASPKQLAVMQRPPSRYNPHMSLDQIAEAYGHPLDDFRLVCVERDPFAKVISFLHMRRNFDGYKAGAPDMAASVRDLSGDLDRVLGRGRLDILKSIHLYGGRQPRVLRYERLEQDFAAFTAELGVAPPPLPHAKRGPLSNAIDPAGLFRRDQIDRLNVLFAPELAAFGYAPR
jgi:hypothetical protein